jgi:hypothetical protein
MKHALPEGFSNEQAASMWRLVVLLLLACGPVRQVVDAGADEDAVLSPGVGRVRLINVALDGDGAIDNFIAGFRDRAACTETRDGDCSLVTCTAARPSVSAGTLTVTGYKMSQFDLTDVAVVAPTFEYFQSSPRPIPLWRGGETLTAQGSGDVVPGFYATVRAPEPVTATLPCDSALGPCTVPPGTDFTVKFTGVSQGRPYFDAESHDYSTPFSSMYSTHIWCLGAVGASALTVSARLRDQFPADGALRTSRVEAGVTTMSRVTAGDFSVTFEAVWVAVSR